MDAFADWLAAPGYDLARLLLQRGIALVYAIAFINVRNQFPALLGETGLLPAATFLSRTGFWQSPSLLHWRSSDRVVGWLSVTGTMLAVAALLGLTNHVPLPLALAWWLLLWFLYLSIVNVGQIFYSFGWESLLLEAGFLVAFLGNDEVATPVLVIWLFRWVLFRVEFGAGLIKLRGDRCWRTLTCLDFHHETQPMPGPLSWWFHRLPWQLHRVEVAANHFAQLVVPVALFAPQPVAGIAGGIVIITQAWLMVSGNYAWLNLVTLLLGFSAIPDAWYPFAGPSPVSAAVTPGWHVAAVAAVTVLVVALSWAPARNLGSPRQRMNASFNRWHLVNAYGAFGSITRARREVVVEGTDRPDPGEDDWRAYEFKGKPTDVMRRPRQVAPYHLRLDWLMWFIPLAPSYGGVWFGRFLQRLLEGDGPTLRLLARNPFPDSPPVLVRARLVDYQFTSRVQRRRTGAFWVTARSRQLAPPRRLPKPIECAADFDGRE